MHVVAVKRDVVTSGVEAQGVFAISAKSQAHIMSILREGLYTDRILAVLREYSANAWDAHRMSGKAELPIKVVLPTDMSPTLVIRDFGMGMSEDDIFGVFTQYGDSTKREDDTAVGCLGIGSKAGFAYSDTFTVISYHGGMKRTYVAVLDQSDIGTMSRLCEEPCGDEVGIEIRIPIKRRDIWQFESTAKTLFRYFEPRPEINTSFPDIRKLSLKHGFVLEHGNEWVAVMGCIPYRINMSQIQSDLEHAGLWAAVSKIGGGLYFEIGDVQVSANREELKYTDLVKKTLMEKLSMLFYEYTSSLSKCMKDPSLTDWQKRIEIQKAFCRFQGAAALRIPDAAKGMTADKVYLWTEPEKAAKTFVMVSPDGKAVQSVPVTTSTAIVIKDDPRSLKGFSLNKYDYVVRPIKGAIYEAVKEELEGFISANRLTGIPVKNISSYDFDREFVRKSRGWGSDGSKYLTQSFLMRDTHYQYPWSSCWDAVSREPTADDVYVIIENFIPHGGTDFFQMYKMNRQVIVGLGGTMPPIYGYKNTAKKPITDDDCMGTPYSTWIKRYFASLVLPNEVQEEFDHWLWGRCLDQPYWGDRMRSDPQGVILDLTRDLGLDHPIVKIVSANVKGKKTSKYRDIFPSLFQSLSSTGVWVNPADEIKTKTLARYPLLGVIGQTFNNLWGENAKLWIDYVKMIDAVR